MGYDPNASGLLTGGGMRHFKVRRNVLRGNSLKHFPDVHISDSYTIKQIVPDFDFALEFEYTKRELLLLAEKILLSDKKPPYESPTWLNGVAMRERLKHEIFCTNGTPDPSIESGLYWRTHPEGRKWKTVEERQINNGAFYR
jgi:hypothetical protein